MNLFSKGTESDFFRRHILHSLSLLYRSFPEHAVVVDWGTGGGFPGLPLAIATPSVQFHLVDAVAKKTRAVRSAARRIGVSNVDVWHTRAEHFHTPVHYSVSRATAPLATLWQWHQAVVTPFNGAAGEGYWKQGLHCLKGGGLTDEIEELRILDPSVTVSLLDLHVLLGDPYFDKKYIVSVVSNT